MTFSLTTLIQKSDYTKTHRHDCDRWINRAIQAAEIGVWLWDITRDRIEITEFGQILHGLTTDALTNYQAWLKSLHTDDQEPTHQAIQRTLTEKTDYRNEYRVIHPDGSVRWIATQGRGDFASTGNPLHLVAILFDVTARKQAEQMLKEQHQLVAHMARVAVLGELSAALSHELSQPLTAILCNAQAGQRFLAQTPPDLEELRTILVDIVADNQRAGTIVSGLRALFKKEEAVQQVLNINALVEDVTQLLRSELIVKRVSLLLHLTADLPTTKGDPVQVRQVLLNLIMNSAEAMAALSTGPRQLRIHTNLYDTGNLEVIVHDTGPGIMPQMMEQIFEPFVTNKAHGLGMGLPISRTIVTAHGGRLWADSSPERGAILHFTLPIIQEFNS